MQIAILGIDPGKNSCSLVGLDGQGKIVILRMIAELRSPPDPAPA